jgi:hypothetical protein
VSLSGFFLFQDSDFRVRVNAGPNNPTGVGTILRLKYTNGKLSPARLITAGSGYWSQDSAVQVLATPAPPIHVEIRCWPNGKTTRTEIPEGSKDISVGPDGKLTSSQIIQPISLGQFKYRKSRLA